MIKRLWTEETPFDVDGEHVRLTGAFGNPGPVQRPHPPILVGGRSTATLRVAAEHADICNVPGTDLADAVARCAVLDRHCADLGRDPASITRSIVLPGSHDRPTVTRSAIGAAIEAGFGHVVLGLAPPYPAGVARWVADELVTPALWT